MLDLPFRYFSVFSDKKVSNRADLVVDFLELTAAPPQYLTSGLWINRKVTC